MAQQRYDALCAGEETAGLTLAQVQAHESPLGVAAHPAAPVAGWTAPWQVNPAEVLAIETTLGQHLEVYTNLRTRTTLQVSGLRKCSPVS